MKASKFQIIVLLSIVGCLISAGAAIALSDHEAPSQALGSIIWNATHPPGEVSVLVTFDGRTSDSVIQDIAKQHGLRPHVVYMQAGNRYGSHRVALEDADIEIVADAREETVQMQEKATTGLALRARRLLGNRSLDDFLGAEHLHDQAKILVAQDEMNGRIANASASGTPLVYALEGLVQKSELARLRNHSTVLAVEVAIPMVVRGSLRPIVDAPEVSKQVSLELATSNLDDVFAELSALIEQIPEVR